jgi:hypothetical protein
MFFARPCGPLPFLMGTAALVAATPALAAPARTPSSAQPTDIAYAAEDTVIYQIRGGETLFTLAARYLNRQTDYLAVQKANRIANPHRIPEGTRLRIPLALLKGEALVARLVAVRGNVSLKSGGRDIAPTVGMDVTQGSALETGADGFLTLSLPNGSRTSLPTLTRMRIERLRRIVLTGSIDYDFTVDMGKVETKAAPLGDDRNGRFRIRTPRAIAAVRGTQFRVGFAADTSLAEVLEGTVAAGAGKGNADASLTAGLGAVVAAGGGLRTEALLAAPDLVQPGKVQVDPVVQLALAPVGQASSYHIQVGEDAGFTKVIAEARSDTGAFSFGGLPNGGLFVRVSAVATSGLEGMAQTYAMRRVLAGLAASAGLDGDAMRFAWGGEGEGKRLYHFQLGLADPAKPLLVDEAGLEQDGIALRHLGPGIYRWRVGLRQMTEQGVVENWLPFEKLTVAGPER